MLQSAPNVLIVNGFLENDVRERPRTGSQGGRGAAKLPNIAQLLCCPRRTRFPFLLLQGPQVIQDHFRNRGADLNLQALTHLFSTQVDGDLLPLI